MIDITELTSEQLAAVQAQLKAQAKARKEQRGTRMDLIVQMLKDKDDNGAFKHTTRDIAMALHEAGVGLTESELEDKKEMEQEIRRIQAKKQQMEKARDKAGELIHPEGTFGYKPSHNFSSGTGMAAGKVRVETVMEFMRTRFSELTEDQKIELGTILEA